MSAEKQLVAYYTILRKGVVRILRIWPQTLLPSVITSVLYFAIFGSILGARIGSLDGIPYILFVVPGLVMLAVIINSYTEVATTFFTAKFFARNIDEILVSPTPPSVIIAGFITNGIVRGVVVGIIVLIVSLFFALPSVAHPFIIFIFLILSSLIFALGGLINGIYAKSFDGVSIVPTFVLTPLVYLGGVFYSINALPVFWQNVSLLNPIFYIVNGFRYGFLGISDVPLTTSFLVLIILAIILLYANWYLLKKGLGLRQ